MPSLQWLAQQRATMPRIRKYLRETGRADVAAGFAIAAGDFYLKDETVADAALRAVRAVGPPAGMREKLAAAVKMMLHASRDAMRIRWNGGVYRPVNGESRADPKKIRFDARCGYYGEAFGILRAMKVIGWGYYGAINTPGSLNEWFNRLKREVLAEEHFDGSGECDHCLRRYGRDDAGRKK